MLEDRPEDGGAFDGIQEEGAAMDTDRLREKSSIKEGDEIKKTQSYVNSSAKVS